MCSALLESKNELVGLMLTDEMEKSFGLLNVLCMISEPLTFILHDLVGVM